MPISYGARIRADRSRSRAIRGHALAAYIAVAAILVMTAALPARAQEMQSLPPVTVDAPPPKLVLPTPDSNSNAAPKTPVVGGSQSVAADRGHERCVDVTIGNDTSFGCINERFKRKVDEVNPTLNTPPIDAKSSDLKVGTVNIPAVQQQYGKNFGHSVVPYRPTIVFPSAMGRH